MQLLFDIGRSLKACPPEKQHSITDKPNGVIWKDRKAGKLKNLVTKSEKNLSYQPREKEKEENRAEGETISFSQDGVLYDKEVIVVELREDGKLELVSGYNRVHCLLKTYGNEVTYFYDIVQFESPFMKSMWKRRYNSGEDHRAQGVPNTIGDYVKGLIEAKKTFDSLDDDAVRAAIDFMAKGKKSLTQIEAILSKFRETNSKEVGIRALNTDMANDWARLLKLPVKGYQKNVKNNPNLETGFTRGGGDFNSKMITWINLIDHYNQPVQITGFVLFAEHDNILKQRTKWIKDFLTCIRWMEDKGLGHYAKQIHFKGFLAQITTADETQGGNPKERGLVDVNGEIIRE